LSEARHRSDLPRPLLLSAGLLLLVAITLVAIGEDLPPVGIDDTASVVSSHDVRLRKLGDGAVVPILNDGTELPTISADKAGFVTGVIRGLSRGRKLTGTDQDAPYRISRLRDGRLLITDTNTDTSINLDVFGSDNARTFANIWEQGEAHASSQSR
jgi:putative photosynthetic complex assembly protein